MRRIVGWTAFLWLLFLSALILVGNLPLGWSAEPALAPSPAPAGTMTPRSLDSPSVISTATGYLGGALGIATANRDIGTGLGYGGEVAFFPEAYVGLGALYRGGNHGTPKTSIFGAQVLLRPVSPLSLGFVLGLTRLTSGSGPVAGDTSSFTYGGRISYDYPIGNTIFSVGPEADLFFYKPSAETVTQVDLLATFRIWI